MVLLLATKSSTIMWYHVSLNHSKNHRSHSESRVLTQMLKSRIKSLVLRHNVTIIHFTFLDDYDGEGRCEKIEFDGTIDSDRYLAASWTWADSVGWKVTEKRNKIILEKEPTLQNSLKD